MRNPRQWSGRQGREDNEARNRGVTLKQARREVDEGRSRIYADVGGRGREKTRESSYQMKFQSKSQYLKV
jgi:hypothetical protein